MNYYDEEWADITGFEGYQVSSEGRVRSFWHIPHRGRGGKRELRYDIEPRLVPQSLDGNGYQKVLLKNEFGSACKKVHRLVAEAFIENPKPDVLTTVDHIQSGPEGKLDNSTQNLQWMSRGDNIRKAWHDGVCESTRVRASRPVWVQDINTRESMMFPSLQKACDILGFRRDKVAHAMAVEGCALVYTEYSAFYVEYLLGKECAMIDDDWEISGGLCDYGGHRNH